VDDEDGRTSGSIVPGCREDSLRVKKKNIADTRKIPLQWKIFAKFECPENTEGAKGKLEMSCYIYSHSRIRPHNCWDSAWQGCAEGTAPVLLVLEAVRKVAILTRNKNLVVYVKVFCLGIGDS
jgi:hypothetical protein